jgi:hypothetical protein
VRYVFVKDFNPAYDALALRYFQQSGIDVDLSMTYEKAIALKPSFCQQPIRSMVESQFCSYLASWGHRSDHRPPAKYVIDQIFATGTEISASDLIFFEGKLKEGDGKLLFTMADVASDISDFYTNFLLSSLRRDLASGDPKTIYKYIEPFDQHRLPDLRTTPRDKIDAAERVMAENLVTFLPTVTQKTILENIQYVLDDHYLRPEHMKRPSYHLGKKDILTCEHLTQHVWLHCVASEPDYNVSVSVNALRGSMVCEEDQVVWLFPGYHVKQVEDS